MKTSLADGLAALGARFGLEPAQLDRLGLMLECLEEAEWAPTTVQAREAALDVHVADALAALEVERLRSAARIADLGSGAGFPGMALAVALPRARVDLLESQRRRCAFLQRLRAHAGVLNAHVVHARVEEWDAGLAVCDVALARALAPQPVVLEYAAPLLRVGGILVDWRGRRDRFEEREAACAAGRLALGLVEIRHSSPFVEAREHHLHVFEKLAATPPGFPRRAGIARKRPLGC